MIVEKIPVEKFVIKEVQGLDPIHVYIEDSGTGQGNLTIRCYDKSWTTYWGAVGEKGLRAFILACNNDYLSGCLSRGLSCTQFSGEALDRLARKTVLDRRRGRLDNPLSVGHRWGLDQESMGAKEARELYDRVCRAHLSDYTGIEHCPSSLMTDLFGEEWWFMDDKAQEPNPDYLYLCRILDAVRAGLREENPTRLAA